MFKKYPLNISVFGAASNFISKKKSRQSFAVGRLIGETGHNLIFGAGDCGVMGQVAKGYNSTNPPAKPFGSTTHYIREIENSYKEGDIHVITTRTMAERKQLYLLSDIILVMPGGNGTGDELLEFLTFKQLASLAIEQNKPITTWDGRILLWKGGVYKEWIALWNAMFKQKMAPDWREFVELVGYKELESILRNLEE